MGMILTTYKSWDDPPSRGILREGTTCIQRGNANIMMGISGYRANANPHELRPCIGNVGKYIPYMDALGMEMVPFEPWYGGNTQPYPTIPRLANLAHLSHE